MKYLCSVFFDEKNLDALSESDLIVVADPKDRTLRPREQSHE